jgi:hypothetical protein
LGRTALVYTLPKVRTSIPSSSETVISCVVKKPSTRIDIFLNISRGTGWDGKELLKGATSFFLFFSSLSIVFAVRFPQFVCL